MNFNEIVNDAVQAAKEEMATRSSVSEAARFAAEAAENTNSITKAAQFIGQCPDIETALKKSNPDLYQGLGAGGSALMNIAMELLEYYVLQELKGQG